MRRHDARILALSALFCWELSKDAPADVFDQVAEGFFEASASSPGPQPRSSVPAKTAGPVANLHATSFTQALGRKPSEDRRFDYAKELFHCAVDHAGEIDPLIAKASQGWPLPRMPRVDLSILRLAVAEAVYLGKAPDEVVIDEALELSKEFSTHASPRFVNGVLVGIFREMGHVKKEQEE